MALLPFARVTRLFVFAYRPRTKTRVTRVNFKRCPILNSKGFLCLLCPRKVEIILSDMVLAMKIFARVARAARVSDLAVQRILYLGHFDRGSAISIVGKCISKKETIRRLNLSQAKQFAD